MLDGWQYRMHLFLEIERTFKNVTWSCTCLTVHFTKYFLYQNKYIPCWYKDDECLPFPNSALKLLPLFYSNSYNQYILSKLQHNDTLNKWWRIFWILRVHLFREHRKEKSLYYKYYGMIIWEKNIQSRKYITEQKYIRRGF